MATATVSALECWSIAGAERGDCPESVLKMFAAYSQQSHKN
jgi:hypothetical protein